MSLLWELKLDNLTYCYKYIAPPELIFNFQICSWQTYFQNKLTRAPAQTHSGLNKSAFPKRIYDIRFSQAWVILSKSFCLLLAAFRTQTAQRQLDRCRLKFRKRRRCFKQPIRQWNVQIDQVSATIADRVIVPRQIAVIKAGVFAEPDLADQSFILQIAQRIVNGCE